ncbi:MAG: phage major capsid protein [Filifactoraceae bacterium]
MNKELRELLNQINAKKAEVKNLVAENKIEEAKAAKAEMVTLQDKFNLLSDMEDNEEGEAKEGIKNTNKPGVINKIANAFVNALKSGLGGNALNEEDRQLVNAMNEGGTGADGGLTVPQDIRTEIKELRRTQDALEMYVNVEPVSTLSGSRVIEKYADQVPFDNVDEAAQFPEVATPQFEKISYKVVKKGGILKVTRELLQDSAENILGYLKRWISKKCKATRNFIILAKMNEITATKEVPVANLDALKDIFNVKLDPAIAVGAKVFTNQDGFNWLDKLKDTDGKYILQPDPTAPTNKLLFGSYPVVKLSNKTMPTTGTTTKKAPIFCGDLTEAITLFDRESMSIELSDQAGDLWGKDQTGVKVRERLDAQAVDKDAIIKGEITLP